MESQSTNATTILDVSKGLGYGFLYHPVIGKTTPARYPFAIRFRVGYRPKSRLQK